ncbi:unnamed protein product [Durusdinium trenchii]|uniref:Feruloyl esterase n=1 Tax=Durusdinium trenchii TaxID=1381693 RepID=A0ABP0L4S6_9DINO
MIRELWEDEIRGEGFGESKFKLYESNEGLREDDANPYFVVWLHGMHCGMIGPKDLKTMQWRLQRRVIFMVPLSPRPCDGLSFNWGCAFTKQQNKKLLEILLRKSAAEFAEEGSWSKELGFVFGHLHYNFLNALTEKINELSSEFNAERIIAMGYSMGGFGAIQLGCFAPELFDAVVSVAGYGMGTSEPNSGYGAPQPVSGEIFDLFLEREACKLARVPVVLAVHAPSDMCSSFRDVSAIIQKTQETAWDTWERSTAKLVRVPDGMANSDHPGKKRKSNHGYFNCTLLHNGSEKMLWRELRRLVDRAPQRGGDSMDWEPERGWGRSRRWSRMYEDPPNSRSWGWCPT